MCVYFVMRASVCARVLVRVCLVARVSCRYSRMDDERAAEEEKWSELRADGGKARALLPRRRARCEYV